MKFKSKSKFLIIIAFLALILRFIAINQSLWLDEAIGALVVREQSYSQILTQFPRVDNHPPLYYLSLKVWTQVFGYSEIALRSLSVLFGIFTVVLLYAIALKISKDKFFAVISTFLLATSPFHIYYSQEARMYSMAAFLAALAMVSFLKVLEKKGEYKYWIIFSISITALVFTDYVPVFLLPVFWIYAFMQNKEKNWWKSFVFAHIPLVLLGLLWLPIFQIQAENGRLLLEKLPAWRLLAGGATFKQAALVWMKFVLGRITFVNKVYYYLLIFISSLPFIYSGIISWKRKNKKTMLFWIWFLTPLVIGFIVSVAFPAFIYFRFLYILPAFYLIFAWGVTQISKNNIRNMLLVSLVVLNIVGWGIYVLDSNQQREQWRQAVNFIESSVESGEIVLFENPEPFAPFQWYETGAVEASGATNSISANLIETTEKTNNLVKDKDGVYYFEYLADLHDPDRFVVSALYENNFQKDNVYDFIGVGQITYFKR